MNLILWISAAVFAFDQAAKFVSIRSRVSALTLGERLSTRDTVRIETPVASATSWIVASFPMPPC